METKIALIFVILLILGAVGINKIIQDSNANSTQNNQINTGNSQLNNQINQQTTPNSPSINGPDSGAPSGGINNGRVDSSGDAINSTPNSGSNLEYK
ncbi:MAG TPA: hypothetical protein HA271_01745 [Methanobacterium subterraneum]|uniref:Uncharacterized protein n=1 Tax=Methanobacterium subterraneum TaxID=59277 RepID=A0A7J4TJ44_9EURY|nr:hypothetical protein [Methanobacterium subterraneum]